MFLSTFLLSLSTLSSFAFAQSSSAVFVYDGADHAQFTFALNADSSTGDLYFHLSSPSGNAWIGVGIGSQMKDSLMFIAYAAGNEKDVTISPRIADGHTEPTYQSNLQIEKQSGDGLTNANTATGEDFNHGPPGPQQWTGTITADAVCRNCSKWAGGSIDFTNSLQPFIFAVGPPFPPLASNSLSAGLQEHMFVGHFTMDMRQASSQNGGSVPHGPYSSSDGASPASNTQYTNDPAPHIHGAIMCLIFVLILPIGSLVLRVWNSVRGHWIIQSIGLFLFCCAFAGGIVISTHYNKSKSFNSAHQIIGILVFLGFFTQLVLGALHHRIYKKEQRKTIMGKIHLYLGPAIIVFGIINGGVGFNFADAGFIAIPYVIVVVIIAAIYSCIRFGVWFRRRKRAEAKEGPEGYQYPQFRDRNAAGYNEANQEGLYPPPYGQDVPLAAFSSNQSVDHAEYPEAQPKPMV